MQTDNTFGFTTSRFSKREQDKLHRKKFRTKDKNILSLEQPIKFNKGRIKFSRDNITFVQKEQVVNLQPINPKVEDRPQQYITQRARSAYMASICQPKAA